MLDENAYYVEITENGKIYDVENEAGIGFTNMPRRVPCGLKRHPATAMWRASPSA